jgi:hypothetical protein
VKLFSPGFYAKIEQFLQDHLSVFGAEIRSPKQPDYMLFKTSWFIAGAYRLLGDHPMAAEYYGHASELIWPKATGEVPTSSHPDQVGQALCHAAIMTRLAGDADLSRRYFEGAATACGRVPLELLERWQPEADGASPEYGDILLFGAYAAARLGRWEQVDQACDRAAQSYRQGRKQGMFMNAHHLALSKALKGLHLWVADPTAANRESARELLKDVVGDADSISGAVEACAYVWDLEGAFLPGHPSVIPVASAT